MLKTFTLDKRVDIQVSETEGTVTFHITDENGDSRKLSASTFLDEDKLPQGVTTEHKRELPLIEGLFRLELDESIEIEFKHYNDAYNRELDKTVNQIAYDKVLEMQKEKKLLFQIGKFFRRFKLTAEKEQSTTA